MFEWLMLRVSWLHLHFGSNCSRRTQHKRMEQRILPWFFLNSSFVVALKQNRAKHTRRSQLCTYTARTVTTRLATEFKRERASFIILCLFFLRQFAIFNSSNRHHDHHLRPINALLTNNTQYTHTTAQQYYNKYKRRNKTNTNENKIVFFYFRSWFSVA